MASSDDKENHDSKKSAVINQHFTLEVNNALVHFSQENHRISWIVNEGSPSR